MKSFSAIALGAVLSTVSVINVGCSTERPVEQRKSSEPQPINFSAQIEERLQTRVLGTKWESGDAIGVFMIVEGGDFESCTSGNVKHIHTTGGGFRVADIQDALFYPDNGAAVDFVAYYPFSDELDGSLYPIDLTDQSTLSDIDILYSNNAQSLSEHSPELFFSHILCRLSLSISAVDPETDLNDLQVRIAGVATRGTFDLATGRPEPSDETGDPLDALVEKASNGSLAVNAILIPQEQTDISIHLIFGDGDRSILELTGKDLLSGYAYEYELSVDQSAKTVVVEDSEIVDWESGEGGKYDVGKGTKKEFYLETLGSDDLSKDLFFAPELNEFTGWSAPEAGARYTSDSDQIKVRSLPETPTDPFIYIPAPGGAITISDLPVDGWAGVTFSCSVSVPAGAASSGTLSFLSVDGTDLTAPVDFSAIGPGWQTVSFPLSGDYIRIVSSLSSEVGIDNIRLDGWQK